MADDRNPTAENGSPSSPLAETAALDDSNPTVITPSSPEPKTPDTNSGDLAPQAEPKNESESVDDPNNEDKPNEAILPSILPPLPNKLPESAQEAANPAPEVNSTSVTENPLEGLGIPTKLDEPAEPLTVPTNDPDEPAVLSPVVPPVLSPVVPPVLTPVEPAVPDVPVIPEQPAVPSVLPPAEPVVPPDEPEVPDVPDVPSVFPPVVPPVLPPTEPAEPPVRRPDVDDPPSPVTGQPAIPEPVNAEPIDDPKDDPEEDFPDPSDVEPVSPLLPNDPISTEPQDPAGNGNPQPGNETPLPEVQPSPERLQNLRGDGSGQFVDSQVGQPGIIFGSSLASAADPAAAIAQPGQLGPVGGVVAPGTSSGTAQPAAGSSTASSSATPSTESRPADDSFNSVGVPALASVGLLAFFAFGIGLLFWVRRRRNNRGRMDCEKDSSDSDGWTIPRPSKLSSISEFPAPSVVPVPANPELTHSMAVQSAPLNTSEPATLSRSPSQLSQAPVLSQGADLSRSASQTSQESGFYDFSKYAISGAAQQHPAPLPVSQSGNFHHAGPPAAYFESQ